MTLTEPIDRKKPNVAAELSMYCDSVCSAPRGPGPELRNVSSTNVVSLYEGLHSPKNATTPEDEADGKADTCTHHSAHSVHVISYARRPESGRARNWSHCQHNWKHREPRRARFCQIDGCPCA
jgi:hypothetical protein